MSANAHYRFRLDERTKGVVFEIVDGTSARAIGTIVRRAAVLNLPTINSTTGYPAAPNTVPHPAKPIANTPAAMSFDQWEKSHPPGGN
jgi:hypothetical protein